MSGEQYSIFIKVDSTQVAQTTKKLEELGITADKTEKSVERMGKATSGAVKPIADATKAIQHMANEYRNAAGVIDSTGLGAKLGGSAKTLSTAMDSAENSTRKAAGAFDSLNTIAKSVHSTFVLFVGIEIARFLRETAMNVGKAADAYTNMKSQLDLATNSQDEMNKAFKESSAIANRYYANVTDIATAYAKFNPIIVSMGRSASDTTKVVSALSASLAISGKNAVDTSETYRQFSQAISGPVIQMEEMNTIIDSNQALWRGLQRQFPDIIAKYGSLKEAISKQAVTSKMLLDATIALGPEFEALAARKVPTMSNAFTVLNNNFIEYIGEADKASGASMELATLILDLAEAFKGSANDANNLGVFVGVLTQAFAGGRGIIQGYMDDLRSWGDLLSKISQLGDLMPGFAGTPMDPAVEATIKQGQGQVPIAELARGKPTTAPKINPPVSKVDSKAAAKEAKDALEAFKAQIAAQVSAAENAEKIFAAQSANRKKRYEIEADQIKGIAELQIRATKSEAMRISIAEEAQTKIIDAINQETNLRQESLAKETEVTQAKLAGIQQELDMADAHKLKLADRLELTTKQSELETELAVKRQEQVQIELDAIGQIQSAERDLAEARQQAEETMVKEEALRQLEIMSSNLEYAKEMATGLADAFGEVGAAIGGMSVAMAEYDKQSATIEIARKEAVDKAEGDQKRITEINDDATKKQAKAQIKAYGDMTQAAQGFFKKGSKGYEAMGAAVKVFRAFEMAQSAMSMANQLSDITKTIAAFVTGETVKTAASTQSVGQIVFNEQTKQLEFFKSSVAAQGEIPIAGFALMAAMAALMASFGISGSGGGGSTAVSSIPGTGTIKGDPSKQSESISRSLEILTENSSNDLNYSADMLASLRNIESALGAASDIIASKVLPTIADVVNKFTSSSLLSSSAVKEAGFLVNAQSLEKVLNSGALQGYLGARVEKETGLFGEFKSGQTLIAKYGKDVAESFGKVVQEIYKSIENVSKSLGLTSEDIAKRADGLKISLGKINLAGMTAEEASKAIESAFSAMSDTMARKLLPEFEAFWRNGEGYFETINRVAEGINRATGNLELLGMEAIHYTEITDKQKDVATEITRQTIMAQGDLTEGTRKYVEQLQGGAADIIDSYKQILDITQLMKGSGFGTAGLDRTMINAGGGLSKFQESLQSFFDNFLTDDQKLTANVGKMNREFSLLGLSMPKTKEEFTALAMGIDRSTDSGKKLFAQVITLSQGFADLNDAILEFVSTAYDDLKSARDRFINLGKGLKNYLDELIGPKSTGMSPENRYFAARSEFARISSLAGQGNEEALNALADAGKSFLDASKTYNASSEQYQADLALVTGELQKSIDYAQTQVSAADAQLKIAESSYSELVSINDSVITVAQGIENLRNALSKSSVLGIPAFANGGYASPGLALVGEQGPELVNFGQSAYVSSSSTTRGFFDGVKNVIEKGDAAQIAELQALVRLQSVANQELIKQVKEMKSEISDLSRKAKLEAAA